MGCKGRIVVLWAIVFITSSVFGVMEPEVAKTAVVALIESGHISEAQAVITAMKSRESDHPGMKYAFYDIACAYERHGDVEAWRALCQDVMARYPDTLPAAGCALHLAKVDIRGMIEQKNWSGAQAALTDIRTRYTGHFDYPWTILDIAHRYYDFGKVQEARALWQEIIKADAANGAASLAGLRLGEDEVCQYLQSGDFAQAEVTLAGMKTTYKDQSDLSWRLVTIANKYESVGRCDRAEALFDEVIAGWPDNMVIPYSKCHSAKFKIWALIDAGQWEAAAQATAKLKSDYAAQQDKLTCWQGYPVSLYAVAERYLKKGMQLHASGDKETARMCLDKAAQMAEQEVLPVCPAGDFHMECTIIMAESHHLQGRFSQAAELYLRAAQEYPQHKMTGHHYFMAGQMYEEAVAAGTMTAAQAEGPIRQAYEHTLEIAADSPSAHMAQRWLDSH